MTEPEGLPRAVRLELEERLGAKVQGCKRLSGGDINEAYRLELGSGRCVFVKTRTGAPRRMFESEARGLRWLSEANALRVPEVMGVGSEEPWLALEYLEPARRSSDFDECLGRGLALLHRFGAAQFGLDHDNFIGNLAQSNVPRPTWPAFYAEARLAPQLELALRERRAPPSWSARFEVLLRSLPERLPNEPPQRLHGDLWAGNVHVGPLGEPCLIDPAAYAGHREVDLAMMRLFGGFSARVFAAYAEVFPPLPGEKERVLLYQLYPLLVHVNLFGAGYVSRVEDALAALS